MDLQRNGDCNDDRINVYPLQNGKCRSMWKDTDQDGYGDSNPPEGITADNVAMTHLKSVAMILMEMVTQPAVEIVMKMMP